MTYSTKNTLIKPAFILWCMLTAAPVMAQNAPPAAPPVPEPPVATDNASSNPAPVVLADEQPTVKTADPKRYISLMFPQQRTQDLMLIHEAYMEKLASQKADAPQVAAETGVNINTLIDAINGDDDGEINPEIYNFSLNSILYDSSNSWSIWVNGHRYNRKNATEPFTVGRSVVEVVNASKNQITFRWIVQGASQAIVMQRWEARQANKHMDKDPLAAKNAKVQYVESEGRFYVTLCPNQTFSSQYMTVMEGNNVAVRAAAATPASDADADLNAANAEPSGNDFLMTDEPSESFEIEETVTPEVIPEPTPTPAATPESYERPAGEPPAIEGNIFDSLPDEDIFQMRDTM
jgi:hypothetical protein